MFAPLPIQAPRSLTIPLADAKNTLEHPAGPEWQLQCTEGTYVLREDFLLGLIPPHPSEPTNANLNVLDPKPKPPEAGTTLSLAVLNPRRSTTRLRRVTTATNGTGNSAMPPSISEHPHEPSSFSPSDNLSNGFINGSAPVRSRFGENNPALALPATKGGEKDALKRRKPKNNVAKSNSSFLSRAIIHEQLVKKLADRSGESAFAFANINRAMLWIDMDSPTKTDPLAKLLFTKAHALCTDFNTYTKTAQHLDVVIGFNTSDLMWWEPITQKYARLNKNGIINPTPVSSVKWLPGSENLFLAAHHNGTLVIYDKEKEDAHFLPEDTPNPPTSTTSSSSTPTASPRRLHIHKSVLSPTQKTNPIAVYKLTNSRPCALAFSPTSPHLLAIVSEDGALRILDLQTEALTDIYSSYYGGLSCVAWSPDGLYLLTGGQDDLVSIWNVADRALVARGVGHHSWVAGVAWDAWRCDTGSGRYRFGSVGEDGRICLWDFERGMLRRPRVGSARPSISGGGPFGSRNGSSVTLTKLNSLGGGGGGRRLDTTGEDSEGDADGEGGDDIEHPVLPRAQAPTLPPVLSQCVDEHPLTWVSFEEDSIVMACKRGHIRTWDRPKEEAPDAPNPFRS